MYDVSILMQRAAELGWLPIRVFREIQKLPKKERISSASVYRVWQYGLGNPDTLRPIAKVLGFELKDLVRRTPADIPVPRTLEAEHDLVVSTKGRTA